MSTQDEIVTMGVLVDNIADDVKRAYTVLKNKGVEPTQPETVANLADTIDSIKTADVVFDPDTGLLTITTSQRVEGELC